MLTAVLRLCGQPATGPTGVVDQSKARVRSPISPPPARKARGSCSDLRLSSWFMCPPLIIPGGGPFLRSDGPFRAFHPADGVRPRNNPAGACHRGEERPQPPLGGK